MIMSQMTTAPSNIRRGELSSLVRDYGKHQVGCLRLLSVGLAHSPHRKPKCPACAGDAQRRRGLAGSHSPVVLWWVKRVSVLHASPGPCLPPMTGAPLAEWGLLPQAQFLACPWALLHPTEHRRRAQVSRDTKRLHLKLSSPMETCPS